MEKSTGDGRRFIMLPSALLEVLSDTALRIILYAKQRQGFVDVGAIEKWELSLTDIRNEFGHHTGYSLNTIRNGIRELKNLNLIIPQSDHYLLNLEEYEKWYYREGLPNSGRGGLPKSGRAGLPKFGSQEKSSKKKKRIRAEGEIAPIEGTISPAEPPVNPKSNADAFDEIFPETKELKSLVKTPKEQLAEQFAELFPNHPSEAVSPEALEKIPSVSGTPELLEKTPISVSGESAQTAPDNGPKTTPERLRDNNPPASLAVPEPDEEALRQKRKEMVGRRYTKWLAEGKRGPWPPPDLEDEIG